MPIVVFNRTLTERVAVAFVAVETSDKKTWMGYQAVVPMTHVRNNSLVKGALQSIPLIGKMIPESTARKLFPQLKDWKYIFPRAGRKCIKCRREKREIYMKNMGVNPTGGYKWQCFPYCHKGEGFPAKEIFEGFNIKIRKNKKREIIIPLYPGRNVEFPEDISIEDLTDKIRILSKRIDYLIRLQSKAINFRSDQKKKSKKSQ